MENVKVRRYQKEYQAWRRMRSCCLSKSYHMYPKYGGKGIKICKQWSDYEVFLKDMGRLPEGYNSLFRYDETKDFSKENCYWGRIAKGRKRSVKQIEELDSSIKKRSNKKINQAENIYLSLEKTMYDQIRYAALQKSTLYNTNVTVNDIIRDALSKVFRDI